YKEEGDEDLSKAQRHTQNARRFKVVKKRKQVAQNHLDDEEIDVVQPSTQATTARTEPSTQATITTRTGQRPSKTRNTNISAPASNSSKQVAQNHSDDEIDVVQPSTQATTARTEP